MYSLPIIIALYFVLKPMIEPKTESERKMDYNMEMMKWEMSDEGKASRIKDARFKQDFDDDMKYIKFCSKKKLRDTHRINDLWFELALHQSEMSKITYTRKVEDKHGKDYEKFDKMQKVLEGKSLISFKEYIFSERNPWISMRSVGLQIENPIDFFSYINIDAPSKWGDNPRKGMAEQFKKDFY